MEVPQAMHLRNGPRLLGAAADQHDPIGRQNDTPEERRGQVGAGAHRQLQTFQNAHQTTGDAAVHQDIGRCGIVVAKRRIVVIADQVVDIRGDNETVPVMAERLSNGHKLGQIEIVDLVDYRCQLNKRMRQ